MSTPEFSQNFVERRPPSYHEFFFFLTDLKTQLWPDLLTRESSTSGLLVHWNGANTRRRLSIEIVNITEQNNV